MLLHPQMATFYRQQVADLTAALNAEENKAEAAELLRTLVDRIELTTSAEGSLDIDLVGNLAGILTMAQNREKPLNFNDEAVQQVKLVAGSDLRGVERGCGA